MKVLSEMGNSGFKNYLVQDNDQVFTADVIFTSRKPRSRVIVEVVKDIKEILEARRDKITHPAYLKYSDIKQINGEYCLLREGEKEYQPLYSYIEENEPTLDKKVEWVITLGEVFEEAENKGLEFPLISLESLWIDTEGNLMVLDPGITALVGQYRESDFPYPSKEIYYPPEFYKKQMIDERGRIYSSGVILYFLLTEKFPFSSQNKADLIDEILNTEPVEPCYFNSGISTKLNYFLLKALKKDSDKRFKNWSDYLKNLERLRNDQDLKATSEEKLSHQERANRILKSSRRKQSIRSFWRKHWKVVTIIAVSIAVFIGIGLMDSTVPVVTTDTSPEQIVELFYQGIDTKNFQYLEETCDIDLKHLDKMVMETYVIEKVKNAYSTEGSMEKVFGLENLRYTQVNKGAEPVFKVNYTFYIYRAEAQRDEVQMEDLLTLNRLQGKWKIIEINGDINMLINSQINELLITVEE